MCAVQLHLWESSFWLGCVGQICTLAEAAEHPLKSLQFMILTLFVSRNRDVSGKKCCCAVLCISGTFVTGASMVLCPLCVYLLEQWKDLNF